MLNLFQHLYVFMKTYYIYILASKARGTLYIGVTNDLARRLFEHRQGLTVGFTKRYNIKRLVYYESTESIETAIAREKQLKRWHRQWKINLIESTNPQWKDIGFSMGMDAETSSA